MNFRTARKENRRWLRKRPFVVRHFFLGREYAPAGSCGSVWLLSGPAVPFAGRVEKRKSPSSHFSFANFRFAAAWWKKEKAASSQGNLFRSLYAEIESEISFGFSKKKFPDCRFISCILCPVTDRVCVFRRSAGCAAARFPAAGRLVFPAAREERPHGVFPYRRKRLFSRRFSCACRQNGVFYKFRKNNSGCSGLVCSDLPGGSAGGYCSGSLYRSAGLPFYLL